MPRAREFKPQELAQLLHACGSSGRAPGVPGFADAMWVACDATLEQFKPHELAIVMWSFARMNCSPGEKALQRAASLLASHTGDLDMQVRLLRQRQSHLAAALRRPARQAASNGLWALAVLWTKPDRAVLARLVERTQRLLASSSSPQAISNVLWAVAKLRYDPGPAFVADTVAQALTLADALGCVAGAPCFAASHADAPARALRRPADLLQLCYSLVELRYAAGPRSLDSLAAAVDKQLPAFSEIQLTTVLTALARMGFDPPAAFGARLCKHVDSLPPAGRPALVAALALLGLRDAPTQGAA